MTYGTSAFFKGVIVHINNLAASNSMLMVAFGIVGYAFLLAAFDGMSVHGFGILGRLSIKQRKIALFGGLALAVGPLLGVMIFVRVGLAEIWIAAGEFLFAGNPLSFVVGLSSFLAILSPLFALMAWVGIRRYERRLTEESATS